MGLEGPPSGLSGLLPRAAIRSFFRQAAPGAKEMLLHMLQWNLKICPMPASPQPVLQAHSAMRGIMDRHGVRCSPEEFHRSVNVLFHDFESEIYDREHRDMWESLQIGRAHV